MGNKTSGDAGGVWVNGGELVLNNGVVIKGMEAQRGGGVLIDAYGKLSMNGGTIGGENSTEGNTVFGENGGGGVLVLDGSFDMVGGTIQSNSAAAQGSGGGVLVVDGSFSMFEGIIQSNSAAASASGGGVAVLTTGTFNLYNGTIKGNRASWPTLGPGVESGGAVFLIADYYGAYFNMYGGTIGGENSGDANTAIIGANSVYVRRGGFTMSGGIITGNIGTSNYSVYITPPGIIDYMVFTMRGTARIHKKDKVFLSSNAIITIGGILSASPAANIIYENLNAGTKLLKASSSDLITGNVDKFLYDGVDGHIVSFNNGWSTTWYGVYQ
jgi:hypothetical protein